MAEAAVDRAWAWVAHLRHGGTTPWSDWESASGEAPATPPPEAGGLPGAQQLELLRRLNLAGPLPSELPERVLACSPVGRGLPELPLVGVQAPEFGPRPVDPGQLDADELLRFATGLVSDDLLATPVPPAPTGNRRPWHRRFRLAGDPSVVLSLRDQLLRAGRPPGGRHPTVLVVGTGLELMLAHSWAARSRQESTEPWEEWLAGLVELGRLAPRSDLTEIADRWSATPGVGGVRLVLDPAAVPGLVRATTMCWRPEEPGADALELIRRVGIVLGGRVPGDQRRRLLLRGLTPRVASLPGPRLGIPAEYDDWVAEQAERLRDQVSSGRYPVIGNPDLVLPRPRPDRRSPVADGVLDVAIGLLINARPAGMGRHQGE